MKKFVLVPDSFKGTMTSTEICELMERAIRRHFPEAQIISIPVADGGEGSVDCFLAAMGGEKISINVKGPYFKEMTGFYGKIGKDTAVIEMAACAGLPLVGDRKNPEKTTTYGVGQLLCHAVQQGCKKIIVGLGGSATNDGGCGAAAAAGVRFYNKEGIAGSWTGTTGDAFIIGNGSSSTHSNAFRVAYNGSVYALSAFNSTGADYAELLEWEDGNTDNADRRGLFVTWGTNDKIKTASSGDEIVGIISATSSVIGNAYEDSWQGMYLTDAFGQPITQTVRHDAEYIDAYVPDIGDDGGALDTNHAEQRLLHEAYDAEEYAVNPDYDPTQEYIPRSQRKEWATVGMLGQLIVIDDGTCTVGGRCAVGDKGKATASESGYKVLKRIDDTHIKIFFK